MLHGDSPLDCPSSIFTPGFRSGSSALLQAPFQRDQSPRLQWPSPPVLSPYQSYTTSRHPTFISIAWLCIIYSSRIVISCWVDASKGHANTTVVQRYKASSNSTHPDRASTPPHSATRTLMPKAFPNISICLPFHEFTFDPWPCWAYLCVPIPPYPRSPYCMVTPGPLTPPIPLRSLSQFPSITHWCILTIFLLFAEFGALECSATTSTVAAGVLHTVVSRARQASWLICSVPEEEVTISLGRGERAMLVIEIDAESVMAIFAFLRRVARRSESDGNMCLSNNVFHLGGYHEIWIH